MNEANIERKINKKFQNNSSLKTKSNGLPQMENEKTINFQKKIWRSNNRFQVRIHTHTHTHTHICMYVYYFLPCNLS